MKDFRVVLKNVITESWTLLKRGVPRKLLKTSVKTKSGKVPTVTVGNPSSFPKSICRMLRVLSGLFSLNRPRFKVISVPFLLDDILLIFCLLTGKGSGLDSGGRVLFMKETECKNILKGTYKLGEPFFLSILYVLREDFIL